MEDNELVKPLVEEYKKTLAYLNRLANAIRALDGIVPTDTTQTLILDYSEYPNTGWRDKILFALQYINEGSAADITQEIMKYEQEYPEDKVLSTVTQYLPTMYSKDLLLSRHKQGKKYIYSIK